MLRAFLERNGIVMTLKLFLSFILTGWGFVMLWFAIMAARYQRNHNRLSLTDFTAQGWKDFSSRYEVDQSWKEHERDYSPIQSPGLNLPAQSEASGMLFVSPLTGDMVDGNTYIKHVEIISRYKSKK
jgi:hypothetical protein